MSNTVSTVRRPAGASFLLALAAVAAVGTLLFFAQRGFAADEYTFLIRGDVMQVDSARKTVKVYSRHTSSSAENDLGGHIIEFNVDGTAFYKYDSKLRKVRTTLGSLDLGHEIVMRGAKKSGGHYNASWIVRNDHTVNLRGIVQGHDISNGILKVDVDKLVRSANGASYRSETFPAGTRLWVYYDKDSTKILSRDGNEINPDEISNNNEKVTITGIDVRYGSRFVAGPDAQVRDGKYTF